MILEALALHSLLLSEQIHDHRFMATEGFFPQVFEGDCQDSKYLILTLTLG